MTFILNHFHICKTNEFDQKCERQNDDNRLSRRVRAADDEVEQSWKKIFTEDAVTLASIDKFRSFLSIISIKKFKQQDRKLYTWRISTRWRSELECKSEKRVEHWSNACIC